MVVFRYLTREIVVTLAGLTSILLFIFLSNQFAQYLSRAAGGGLPGVVIMQLMMLEIPNLLGLLLPLGFYIAILVALGRLYADSELTVLRACGYSRGQLLRHVLSLAIVMALLVASLLLWLSPEIATMRSTLLRQKGMATLIKTISPARFRTLNGGKRIFYVESISRDHRKANGIFLAQKKSSSTANSQGNAWDILWAEKGEVIFDKQTEREKIAMHHGSYYQGVPGQANFKVSRFVRYETWPPQISVRVDDDTRTLSTQNLLKGASNSRDKLAELHWRLALPVMVLVLAFLAIPLSYVNPRQGKYAKLLPAIIIYIVYANMLFVGRDWLLTGRVPAALGLWWLHGTMLVLGMIIWFWTGRQR